MKRMLQGFFSLVLLMSTVAAVHADNETCVGTPYFSIRSQSENAARDLVGWQTHINRYDMDCFNAAFAITPEYTRSFRANDLSKFLFGSHLQSVANPTDSSDTSLALRISGSQITNRGANDWLADYFGLSDQYESTVVFKPRISNFLVDFALYMGFDEWCSGLYFRIHAPVVYTRWSLNAEESNIVQLDPASNLYAGYIDSSNNGADLSNLTNADLQPNWITAMQGNATFGDMQDSMKFGKLPGGTTGDDANKTSLKKTRLSDIQADLGWNFWSCEDYNLGLFIRAAAPTGNRPEAEFLFEPIVGNGHHWELGAGVNASAVLWRGCDEDRYLGVYAYANATHLFNTKQKRSFDLNGKPNSRYMLVEEFTSTIVNNLTGNAVPANFQYVGQNGLHPLINLTTLDVDCSIAVQGDLAIKLSYISCGLEIDLGYNLWGRTGEKFKVKNDPIGTNKYGLKGDAFIYGFQVNSPNAVALSATESAATINGGTNFVPALTPTQQFANEGINNPQLAGSTLGNLYALPNTVIGSNIQRNTSIQPVLLTIDDVNTGKTPSAMSNKVFAHVGYSWLDCEDWVPFLGIGGEAEFGSKSSDNCVAAVSQWGVWVKGGIAFN